MNSIELREQRAKLISDARTIVNKADAEQRSLLAEEKEQWDKFEAEAVKLEDKIETMERREKTERYERDLASTKRQNTPTFASKKQADYDRALSCWLQGGRKHRHTSDDFENAENAGIDLNNKSITISFNQKIKQRSKRGSTDALADGNTGYGAELNTYQFGQGFDEAMLFAGNILNDVTIRRTPTGIAYQEILVDDTANNAAIVNENDTVASSFSDMATTNVQLSSFLYRTQIQVSRNLIQDSIVPVIPLVTESIAKRLARKWNSDAMIGAGTTLPYGLVTRSTDSTVVVAGSNASPQLSYDDPLKLIAAMDPSYVGEQGAGFYMHSDTKIKFLAVKDDNGRYILNLSTVPNGIDSMWGYPVTTNNAMAKLSSASGKSVIFASPKHYVWRMVAELEIVKTEDLYLPTNEVGFFAFARADGNLINPKASYYLKAPAA